MMTLHGGVVIAPWGTLEADCVSAFLADEGLCSSRAEESASEIVLALETTQCRLLKVITDARRASSSLPLLVVARSADDEAARMARSARAAGLVGWSVQPGALLAAVCAVVGGGEVYPRRTASVAYDPVSNLTARERTVLDRLARGDHNRDIAVHLGISPHTVRTHVQRVLDKLDVPHRHAAAALARRSQLMPPLGHVDAADISATGGAR